MNPRLGGADFVPERAEEDMNPAGGGVELSLEGAEVGMNPSGSDEVFVDCGCSQRGRCIGKSCCNHPDFLRGQKEKYEALQKKKPKKRPPEVLYS